MVNRSLHILRIIHLYATDSVIFNLCSKYADTYGYLANSTAMFVCLSYLISMISMLVEQPFMEIKFVKVNEH